MTCFLQAVVCPVADPKCFDSNSDPLDPEVDTESNLPSFYGKVGFHTQN